MSTEQQLRSPTSPRFRRTRLALLCFSVGANAICAGGVFCFPIISPALAEHLKLTQPQLTTIALAGMMGQYPFAAFVGKILDYYGAWACSLIAACLFSVGFGLFAHEIAITPDSTSQPSASTFYNLVIFFFIGGLGAVFSYFSSIFAASKNFPNFIGMAAGTAMSLFGLSPTFLSFLASRFFSLPDGELDVTHFLQFLAVLCGCVHLVGALTMHVIPASSTEGPAEVASDPEAPHERTSLLPNKTNGNNQEQDLLQVDVVSVPDEPPEFKNNAMDLLMDRHFWVLAFISFVVLGSCEMVISNIGTIVLSLRNQSAIVSSLAGDATTIVTTTQVRTLSITNTLSRLVIGPLADIVSSVPSRDIENRGFLREHRISRIAFLALASAVCIFTYAWMAIGVTRQSDVWVLSVGAGFAYGCVFAILPSLVSSIWGLANLGRNFGILTYSPFLGTPVFSYLYAFVAEAHVSTSPDSDGVCYGPVCWKSTFEVSAVALVLAFASSIYLARAWKGRV